MPIIYGMTFKWKSNKFETEVHFGFLIIILLLVCLNFYSNLILFESRTSYHDEAFSHLNNNALAISRQVQEVYPQSLSEETILDIVKRYNLSGLTVVPSRPSGFSPRERGEWLTTVINCLPGHKLTNIANKLFKADMNELARGEGNEFYMLYPIPAGAGQSLLILSVDRPELAYIDDSRSRLVYILIGSLFIVAVVYIALSRFIFGPFRKIRAKAAEAGRPVDDTGSETDAIVSEYEQIIEQLNESQAELVKLNRIIQNKADSLEEFNQFLLQSSQSGIVTLDSNGVVIGINNKATQLLCVASKNYQGLTYTELLDGLSDLKSEINRAVEDEIESPYREYTDLFEHNKDTVLGASVSHVRNKIGNEVGILIILNDLTELTRLRKELESRNKLSALGEMAGGLAHQIRNSLGAINGYATLVRKQLATKSIDTKRADILIDETHEAENLIGRFLEFARPSLYEPRIIDLNEVIKEAMAQCLARDQFIDSTIELNSVSDIPVMGDSLMLKQVFSNLIDNALRASDDKQSPVEISMASNAGHITVRVIDHGCGIQKLDIDKVFTPFYSSRPSGNGLGLPLAKKIIELHGGTVCLESSPGEGSTFSISFPIVASGEKIYQKQS